MSTNYAMFLSIYSISGFISGRATATDFNTGWAKLTIAQSDIEAYL